MYRSMRDMTNRDVQKTENTGRHSLRQAMTARSVRNTAENGIHAVMTVRRDRDGRLRTEITAEKEDPTGRLVRDRPAVPETARERIRGIIRELVRGIIRRTGREAATGNRRLLRSPRLPVRMISRRTGRRTKEITNGAEGKEKEHL